MARVNVEDSLFKDQRFMDLVVELKGFEPAIGAVVKCWMIAQEYWKHSDNGIPKAQWKKQRIKNELITCGLAEDLGDFVKVVGSENHFNWMRQRVEAGKLGGIESGKARTEIINEIAKRNEAEESKPKQTQPSSSYSYSYSNSKNKESIGRTVANAPAPKKEVSRYSPEQKSKAHKFVGEYVKAWQTKFPGSRPEDLNDGKTQGQILNWVKDYPIERACSLIQVYFQMECKWFGTKGYDFVTFRNNLNKIGQALDSGKDPDGNAVNWNSVFNKESA